MERAHQGEILLLLSNRSRIKKEEIAKNLNINPSHLSKLFKSEILTSKIKAAASAFFGVDLSIFDEYKISDFPQSQVINDPGYEYQVRRVEEMTAVEVLRYLEEKDRRHHDERVRLLIIIENLTNK